jgi:uncharacterized membrane protein
MAERLNPWRGVAIALTILGILDAGYLTWAHYSNASVLCAGSNQCDIVQESVYASVAGVPVALLGFAGYVIMLILLLLEQREGSLVQNIPVILFGLTLVGAAYSAYLTYLELYVILAICPYCVASAVIMAALFAITIYRLFASETD